MDDPFGGVEYFDRNGLRSYLEDALCGLLATHDKNHCTDINAFMLNYFWHVKNGTHTTLREYEYVRLTPFNRISFLSNVWKSFQSLEKRKVTPNEFFSLTQLVCPDIPRRLLTRVVASLKAGQQEELSLTYADLYRVFQFHVYFEDFVSNLIQCLFVRGGSAWLPDKDSSRSRSNLGENGDIFPDVRESPVSVSVQTDFCEDLVHPETGLRVNTTKFKCLVPDLFANARFSLPSKHAVRNCAKDLIKENTVNLDRLFYNLASDPHSAKEAVTLSMGLSWRVRFGYAIGHVLNDLCASVWFTYTLVYFKFGVGVPTVLAGTVVLLGQVADGLATPLVGYFSDKTSSATRQAHAPVHYQRAPNGQDINGYAETTLYASDSNTQLVDEVTVRSPSRFWTWLPRGRKAWHFVGSLLVITSFPLLFGSPFATHHVSTWAKMIYYSPVVILFQIGWAAVQITHLAMMNDLTLEPGERTLLTSMRYLFTVLSNLAVYLCTFFLLHHTPVNPEPPNGTTPVTESGMPWTASPSRPPLGSHPLQNDVDFGVDDLPAFRNLSLAIIAVGGFVTLLFHICVRTTDFVIMPANTGPTETTPLREAEMSSSTKSEARVEHRINSWRDWLRIPLFWVQGLFYMTVRLTVNVSQAYITVYLLHSLLLPKQTMALVPLTIYLTSMATLLFQKPIQDKISRELNSVIGMVFVIAFCIMVKFPGSPVVLARVYISAGILGIGCTIILITGLAMVSDLIGKNPENGAFVYGYMSFTDKLANGIVIQVIESLCNSIGTDHYYEDVEAYGIITIVVIGLIFLALQTVVKWRTYGQISLIFAQPSTPILS